MATLSFTGTAERAASDCERDAEPVAGDHSRVQAVGDRAQLLERDRDLLAGGFDLRLRLGIVGELVGVHPELERERDQPLLGAVVEVALEPLALLLAGLDHARARALELLQLRLELDLQAPVLERDPRRRADRLQQLRLLVERGVVDEGRQMSAVAVDQGDGARVAGAGQADRSPVLVGPRVVLR